MTLFFASIAFIVLSSILRIYNGATLWDKAPFLYRDDNEGKKPYKPAAYAILALSFTPIAYHAASHAWSDLLAWQIALGLFVLKLAGIFAYFAPAHAPILIGSAKSTPRSSYEFIDKIVKCITGWDIAQAKDGSSKAKNVRAVWGSIRYMTFGLADGALMSIAFLSWIPLAGGVLGLAVGGLYRAAYHYEPEHGETLGHAAAGAWFGTVSTAILFLV